jgi:hypothetical protein
VARLILEQVEDQVLEIALLEHPSRPPMPELILIEHITLLINISRYILIYLFNSVKLLFSGGKN